MGYAKHGLKVFGLMAILSALGAVAFASAAQALTPGFLIGKKTVGTLKATAGGVQEGVGFFLVPALNFKIECKEFEVLEGVILSGTAGDLKLLYKECKTSTIKAPVEELPCHVSDVQGGKPEKLHITNTGASLKPIEFASGDFGVLSQLSEFFLNFLAGTGCPLTLKNKISGSICSLIESATNDTVEPLALVSEAIQKSNGCEAKLLFGAVEAFADGAGKTFLTGVHKGLTLGVSLAP